MSKRRKGGASPQRCLACNDPLGDHEAMVVTGNRSTRVHYVHRPSTRERELCFTNAVQGRDSHSIALKVAPEYTPSHRQDVTLALHLGLDKRACAAVGLDYGELVARRTGGGRR
jgi:hypothetical protein